MKGQQTTLQLTYEPVYKDQIKQSWKFTFARQKRMSVYAKRILAMVFSQIEENLGELKPYYQFKVNDLRCQANLTDNAVYRRTKEALIELASTVFEIENEKEQRWMPVQLLSTSGEVPTQIHNGVATVVLNHRLAPMFLQLRHYTSYKLKAFLALNSWYAMRLYEVLSAFEDTGWWQCSVEEYRHVMDLLPRKKNEKVKYSDVNRLIERTISGPQQELEKTDMAFDFVCKRKKSNRGKQQIVGFCFTIRRVVEKAKTGKEKMALARNHALTAHLVKVMEERYGFKENQMLVFMEMGRKKIGELIYTINVYQSKGNIINLKAYAFTVFKKALQDHHEEKNESQNISFDQVFSTGDLTV